MRDHQVEGFRACLLAEGCKKTDVATEKSLQTTAKRKAPCSRRLSEFGVGFIALVRSLLNCRMRFIANPGRSSVRANCSTVAVLARAVIAFAAL